MISISHQSEYFVPTVQQWRVIDSYVESTPHDMGDGGWVQKLYSFMENHFYFHPLGDVDFDFRLNLFGGWRWKTEVVSHMGA